MSSGVPMARVVASGAMRLIMPDSALPAPISQNSVTPARSIQRTLSRQRTDPVTCAISRSRMRSGSVTASARTLTTTGTVGAGDRHGGQRLGHHMGCGLHQRAMEGRGDRQDQRPLGAPGLGDLDRAFDRGLVARDDDLRGVVVVGGLADLALRGLGRDGGGGLEVEAEEGRHRADADRHRLLHRLAPDAQQARGIGQGQRPRRAEGGVFAQRVPGDEARLIQPEALRPPAPAGRRSRWPSARAGRSGSGSVRRCRPPRSGRRAFRPSARRPRRTRPSRPDRPRPARGPCRWSGRPAPERRMRGSWYSPSAFPLGYPGRGLQAPRVRKLSGLLRRIASACARGKRLYKAASLHIHEPAMPLVDGLQEGLDARPMKPP